MSSLLRKPWVLALVVFGAGICVWNLVRGADLDPLCARAFRTVEGGSAQPLALDAALVGSYAALAKSGAGYFYDDVLEYRVWVDTELGDRYRAFAQWEAADAYARATQHAEPVIVLVRQVEHVNEPEPGVYEVVREERIAEWRVEWLEGAKRGPTSIAEFLKNPRKMRTAVVPDGR